MTWQYLDPKNGRLPTPEMGNPGAPRDFFWQGMRKGGDRLWVLTPGDGPWNLNTWRPGQTSSIYSITLEDPPDFGNFSPRGVTTDKHHVVVSAQDTTSAQPDSLVYFDYEGNHVATFTCSDASDRANYQLVCLEHDFYVIFFSGEGFGVKVYDGRGQLIRNFALAGSPLFFDYSGITTDGKCLYVPNVVPNSTSFVRKVDTRGEKILDYIPPEGEYFQPGITFNGRYLIVNATAIPPGP